MNNDDSDMQSKILTCMPFRRYNNSKSKKVKETRSETVYKTMPYILFTEDVCYDHIQECMKNENC